MPNWHASFIGRSRKRRISENGNLVEDVYPSVYWPGDAPADHLEFALKYDGVNLSILASLFDVMDEDEILRYIRSRPTGKYARRLWYLYEFLTGKVLEIDDLTQGNYIELLDANDYYTTSSTQRIRRQRIIDNLLGDRRFCPLVRRTARLREFEESDMAERCRAAIGHYPEDLLKRALGYLYTRETKSSFEIENITPTATRIERFIASLELAEREDFCEKAKLIELQNRIVDPRFQDSDYRKDQNYVGETAAWRRERIHFVGAKPEDLVDLMDGLIAAHKRMEEGKVQPVIHAAVVSYGFVFLHPFTDGNGRIHRFLIHNILARRGFAPKGVMFPVSATMLNHPSDYDGSLEAFSRYLMPLVEYSLDEDGRMTVHNRTARWYRYMDLTVQAEALFGFIERTIEEELPRELAFLASYDKTKRAIQEIVDMPDREIDLFIRCCLQNNGRLSMRKRESHFAYLSNEEVSQMEHAVRDGYGLYD
ncbi:Fic family protein [Candidatus Parcubacteria bacterium]|nr:MAG: Fic family protein [Candidatus Parcubacteria bacterium]